MSKSIKLNLSSKHYKNLQNCISIVLLDELPSNSVPTHLLKSFNTTQKLFNSIINNWWQGETKYLTLNHSDLNGLSVRLYKKSFKLTKSKLTPINQNDQGSVYFRYRERTSQKLITKKLGAFIPTDFKNQLALATKLLASNELGTSLLHEFDDKQSKNTSITLNEFLMGEFYELKLNENPKTVDEKVNNVIRNFKHLLALSLSEITADKIKEWLKSKERKLTKRQINAGESRWVVTPSTLKGAVCTIRSCIQLAKEKGVIKDHDLYTLPKFKMDNEIIRYLSKEEEVSLYRAINNRNEKRLQERVRTIHHRCERHQSPPPNLVDCAFSDHVTPFIILFKETGIRPNTILNSLWSDIDFESRFFRIRKSIDKRALANFVPLNDLAFSILTEWRKHHIHKECLQVIDKKANAWLFPSPKNPKHQLTTIKSAWLRLIKEAKIENFRFYDLRHDFASKVMMKTGNIYLVSHLLNHKQIETTKRYAHLMDHSKMIAVQTLDKDRANHALPNFLKA